jgi:4'-phosphopantetheinyl transferase
MTRGEVRVWYSHANALSQDPARVARALGWLLPVERARYDRFRHDADRLMFLAGRVMARTLVSRALGCAPTTRRWREGPHGRPEIDEPGVATHFNLAHSAGLVVCAVAPDREVGVDVEDLRRRPVDRGFVARYCSPDETADVAAQPEDAWHDRFLTYWTLKEAYLKARGLGVSVSLSSVSFTLDSNGDARVGFLGALAHFDNRWLFHLTRPTDRHLLAVAVATADGARPAVRIQPFEFGDVASW